MKYSNKKEGKMAADKNKKNYSYQMYDHVFIKKDLPRCMRHFPAGREGIITGYDKDYHSEPQYQVYVKGIGDIAWYYHSNLILLGKNKPGLLKKWKGNK